ncbi:divalent-cation tolerance protein CutA [Helicobacter sp. 23-1045]
MAKICVIMTSCGDEKSADLLSEMLVREKLAACVQIQRIKSRYLWQGELRFEREFLLIIKTLRKNRKKIKRVFKAHHPYELPEFVCFDADSSKEYSAWIEKCC